jgi:integrase/recombinase XerD
MQFSAENHTTISELSAWFDAFIVDRQAANLSPSTVSFYQSHLGKFIRYCHSQAIYEVESITPNLIRRFLLWLETEGHNPGGIHIHYRATRAFVRWWIDETEPIDYKNPFNKVKAPKLSSTPLPPVSQEDISALLKICGKDWHGLRDTAMLLCLLDTGARAVEFLSLNVEDVNLRIGSIYIAKGKGNKSRTVFIGKASRRALRRYLRTRHTGPIWVKQNGERLSYWGLRQILRRRANQAGIESPSTHAFRRAFCVSMLRAGVDFESLRRLMGHADYQVLKRYLDLLDEDLQRVHAKASPADQLRNLSKRR